MKTIITLFIISFFLFSSAFVTVANAQSFKFELASPSGGLTVGKSFQVKVLINTAGVQAINGDALIVFDPAKVSLDSAASGNFFTYFSANPLGGSTTKYLVSSWEESVAHAKSSSADTLFATTNLTAKAAGTTNLSFDCTAGTEADSNINRSSDSADVIKCPLPTLSLSIGGAGPTLTPGPTSTPSATPTKKPTSTPVPTNTPAPTISQLPRAGTVEVTIAALGIGALLTVVGILLIL